MRCGSTTASSWAMLFALLSPLRVGAEPGICPSPTALASAAGAATSFGSALERVRMHAASGDIEQAARQLEATRPLALQPRERIEVDVEQARVAWLARDVDAATAALGAALAGLEQAPSEAQLRDVVGLMAVDGGLRSPAMLLRAHQVGAGLLGDDTLPSPDRARLLSTLARLFQWSGQTGDATRTARRAVMLAQQSDAPIAEYQAATELAAALALDGNRAGAAQALETALKAFDRGRSGIIAESMREPAGFRGHAGRAFLMYADLLASPAQASAADLWQAVAVVEQLKRAEIDEFFLGRCDADQGDITPMALAASLPATDLLLYPIVLPERTLLLAVMGGEIARFDAGSTAELSALVRDFRLALLEADPLAHQATAQHLYGRLLQPAAALLAKATRLRIVADGVLRLVPWGALHDGERYLIESHEVTTSPALIAAATTPRDTAPGVVLAGISESVQGFPALPGVSREIEAIGERLDVQDASVLLDRNFDADSFEALLKRNEPGVVHVATHGEIGSRADMSYLLTYDGRIGLDRFDELLRNSPRPPDLIALSACQTASGDDRSVLGLGGIALQAGAGRVLATLWYVSDAATAALMERFYRDYAQHPDSAAKALRAAQRMLLSKEATRHPRYWAPYILVERL